MKLAVGNCRSPFLVRPTVLVDDGAGTWHRLSDVWAAAGLAPPLTGRDGLTISVALGAIGALKKGERGKLVRAITARSGQGDPNPALRKPVDPGAKVMVIGGWIPASTYEEGAEAEVGLIRGDGEMARWMQRKDLVGRKITAFKKFPSALADPGGDIGLPRLSLINASPSEGRFEIDATLGVVIGKPAQRVTKRSALRCVGGLTLLADIWDAEVFAEESRLRRGMLGKNLRSVSPAGPWIELVDDGQIDPALEVSLSINGETRQRFRVADLCDGIAETISHCSSMGLQPGDILAMGARIAVTGDPLETPIVIRPGDTVEIKSPAVGALAARLVEGDGWSAAAE